MDNASQNQAASRATLNANPRVLIFSPVRAAREVLTARVAGAGLKVHTAGAMPEAAAVLTRERPDVVLLHATGGVGDVDSAVRRMATQPGLAIIVVSDTPSLDAALTAMRAGAADLVSSGADGCELARRISMASQRARELAATLREQQVKIRRLRKICKDLHAARQEVSAQVGSLCQELAKAYGDIADRASLAAIGGEFNGVIRQELDLEALLRVALEFILGKSGPTNAAVFLPSTTGDYSLGAYVNCDAPRDTAEILMDHLCQTVAPRLETAESPLILRGREQLIEHLGEAAEWVGDANLLAIPCRHEGECLAVLTLFRPQRLEYEPPFLELLPTIAELFARQLARVIRVHHRHTPKHQWGAGDQDDLDLSA